MANRADRRALARNFLTNGNPNRERRCWFYTIKYINERFSPGSLEDRCKIQRQDDNSVNERPLASKRTNLSPRNEFAHLRPDHDVCFLDSSNGNLPPLCLFLRQHCRSIFQTTVTNRNSRVKLARGTVWSPNMVRDDLLFPSNEIGPLSTRFLRVEETQEHKKVQ